ncbi:hypothetical protein B0H13DRAFT_2443198 [Mycena leptocephala]|nr:hypothetical protein B0H13DRAFT_2443198 [Mycena leptocephala]
MPQDEKSFILAGGAAALIALHFLRPEKNVAPVPPGPKGVRILENVPDLPPSQPWLTFSQWAKNICILGKSIIILNDVKLATDMLENKSRIWGEAPCPHTIREEVLPACAFFSSMLSTSRASPAFFSLLKTLNMNIFIHIWMCRWNPNAFAHDILVSVARPAPFPFCDECGLLSESRDFGAFPSPLPCPLFSFYFFPVHSPFHPPLPSYFCPLNSTPASTHGLISVPARACTVPYLKQQERVSPHRACCPPRRSVPNAVPHAHPAHTMIHSPPPAFALPVTYVPPCPPCPCPAQRYPAARSSRPPCVLNVRLAPPSACAASVLAPPHAWRPLIHRISWPCEHHRSSPATAARPVRLGHPTTTPPSAAHPDSVPLAHVAFSASRNCDPSILVTLDAHTAHAPGTTTSVDRSGRGTRCSSRTPPPSPPEAIHLRGEPMHARSKMPRSSATGRYAARETRTRCIAHALSRRAAVRTALRGCTPARGREGEGVWKGYCVIPRAVMYFYTRLSFFFSPPCLGA